MRNQSGNVWTPNVVRSQTAKNVVTSEENCSSFTPEHHDEIFSQNESVDMAFVFSCGKHSTSDIVTLTKQK